MTQSQTLQDLHREMLPCTRCGLSGGRTRVVPGVGRADAKIMFIGEGPGLQEDRQGVPFVGPAGQFLNELLASIGLKREDVYITNVVKCRPPENRDPMPGEIAACRPWLDEQTALIKPKVIVTLGRHSMARYFPGELISRVHGLSKVVDGITVFAMYHPAAALHQDSLKATLRADIQKLPPLVAQIEAAEQKAQQPAFAATAVQASLDGASSATVESASGPTGRSGREAPEQPQQLSMF